MTAPNTSDPSDPQGIATAGDDQRTHDFGYGHGRMPFFLKFVWLAFLAFSAWYIVKFLLAALAVELG